MKSVKTYPCLEAPANRHDWTGERRSKQNRFIAASAYCRLPLSTLPSCETSATRKSLLYCIPSPRLKPLSLRCCQLKFCIFTPCSRGPRSLPRPHLYTIVTPATSQPKATAKLLQVIFIQQRQMLHSVHQVRYRPLITLRGVLSTCHNVFFPKAILFHLQTVTRLCTQVQSPNAPPRVLSPVFKLL